MKRLAADSQALTLNTSFALCFFHGVLLQDTIKVEPKDFGKDPVDAIKEEIHRRYANKVK